jgi:tetratricopeptide (TPR) repeat protein
VKIVDFGLARLNEERLSLGLTNSQQTLGTLDYMAPEQFDDASRVDFRADIYSLGCTLFTLLAGNPPFPAPQYSSLASKMQAHCLVAPPKVNALRPDVPLGVSNIIEQMLAKQPGKRFASPIQVAKALAPFAAGSNPCELVQNRQHAANRSNNPIVGQTSNYLSNPSTETNGGEFKQADSVAPIAVAAPQIWKSAAFRIAVAAALLIAVVLWAAWPRPHPDGGNKANDLNHDQAGSSLSNKPQLSLASVVGTAPGLTGAWWFDETPWLIPQARQRWLPFMKVGFTAPESARKDLSDRLTKLTALANGSDVFELQQQLKLLATERLPGGTWDETRERVELCNLLDLSGSPGADSKQLGNVRDLLLKKCRTGGDKAGQPELDKLSAADCHLFAVVLHRMARSSNVGGVSTPSDSKSARAEAAPRKSVGLAQSSDRPDDPSVMARLSLWKNAKSAYELALKKYDRDGDQTMMAACFADLAVMYSEQGDDAAAVDNFRLAQTSLPEGKSPLFETFVLCGQANSNCQLSKHNAAHECLKRAEETATELPPDHPLRAYVWECMAWYYMDRDYMDAAARRNAVTYFEKAKAIREDNAKRDPRASRDIFHDRHGAALALQYRGVFEHEAAALNDSKQRFTEILKELTEQLADPQKIYERDPEQITPQMRNDLVQRKINALEREADGYLFGSPREFKTAAEHYLDACKFIKSEGLDRNLKSSTVVSLLFKRAMALAFAGDLVAAGQCKAEADELFSSLKDENKPLAFVRTVASSAIDRVNHRQTAEQIRHNFVAVFREKLATQDDQRQIHLLRDDRLQFDVLAAEMTDPDLFQKVSEEALKPK